jgi:hypothetical protein
MKLMRWAAPPRPADLEGTGRVRQGKGCEGMPLLQVEAFEKKNTGEGIGAHEIDEMGCAAQAGRPRGEKEERQRLSEHALHVW